MIYTVTLNPSLDYHLAGNFFSIGQENRAKSAQVFCGGKGINVSAVLSRMWVENLALGFVGGFVGQEIRRAAKEMGVREQLITIPGCSRINVKLSAQQQTAFNAPGPVVPEDALARLEMQMGSLGAGDVLVLSGSTPPGVPSDFYQRQLHKLTPRGVVAVVDAAGAQLANALKEKPFLIKPNQEEATSLIGDLVETPSQANQAARIMQKMGARNVLVSMGASGCVFRGEAGEAYYMTPPAGRFVNGVGAGDSMVAGFLAGWLIKKSHIQGLVLAVAAGSACAYCESLPQRKDILKLTQQVAFPTHL